jgi:hypothetical protein
MKYLIGFYRWLKLKDIKHRRWARDNWKDMQW